MRCYCCRLCNCHFFVGDVPSIRITVNKSPRRTKVLPRLFLLINITLLLKYTCESKLELYERIWHFKLLFKVLQTKLILEGNCKGIWKWNRLRISCNNIHQVIVCVSLESILQNVYLHFLYNEALTPIRNFRGEIEPSPVFCQKYQFSLNCFSKIHWLPL